MSIIDILLISHRVRLSFNLYIQILCIGVLIPAAISISAIDKIKDVDPREELRLGFGDADDERRVALSLVCISSLAIAFQIVMIAVCILYITLIVKNLFVFYAFLVSEAYIPIVHSLLYICPCILYMQLC